MGKTNKANRTKGNTRPSSSEHSAQLLSLSGKSFSGFIGFDSLEKDIPSYIPVTGQHSSDASDLSVDSELRMVMRKMLKRDSVTRLKAVQEFGDLCAEKDKDIVKSVLPFWPRLFNKLSLDCDRRIREATHQANGKLITKVKREIAPYLKNIMGVWLLGQNDFYPPAASAAQAAFIDTFPKNKQSEALMFCKNEIFSLFKDNLFEQTAKTMSDPSSASAEDIENKYNLVISATFQALKLFLCTISSTEILNIQEDYISIVSENKFWKYAKSKESQIRGSWYSLISMLCNKRINIFADMEKKLVTAVFSCLSETDPVVAPAVWEAALHIVVNLENCWQEINIQKVVLPQLWSLLSEAGKGNAHIIYPCILPFLSKFPKEVLSTENFLLQFFCTLRQSILLDSVKMSPMECDAVLNTFMECLQYFSFHTLETDKEGLGIIEKVFYEHVIPLIEISFYKKQYSYLATSKFYPLLGSLVQKIEVKHLDADKESAAIFSSTIDLFWNNLYNIFIKMFDKNEEEKTKISVYVTYFFHSMFNIAPCIKLEKVKVRFKDEVKTENMPQVSTPSLPAEHLYRKMPLSFKHLIKFIKILCIKTDENINICYLKMLDEILASTLNSEFLRDLLKSFEETSDLSEKESLTFFNKIILKWISVGQLDQASVTCISDIVFSLCSTVSEEDALVILDVCSKVKSPIFLENILSKSLKLLENELVIQKWLKTPSLTKCILNDFKEMMESLLECEILKDDIILCQKNLLLMCLDNSDLQEILKQHNGIEKILQICQECIKKCIDTKNIDLIIEICCPIIKTSLIHCKDCWRYSVTDDLLSLLFSWLLSFEVVGSSGNIYGIVEDVWHTAIASSYENNITSKKENFIYRAAQELNSSLCNLKTSKKAAHLLNEIWKFLHVVGDILSNRPHNYCSTFVLRELLKIILPADHMWEKLRENLSFSAVPSALERKFIFNFDQEIASVSHEDVVRLLLTSTVIAQFFTLEIVEHNSYEDELYFEQDILKHLPNLLWCLSYCSGEGYMSNEFVEKLDVEVLLENCMKVLQFIPTEKIKHVLQEMFYRSLSEGLYWAIPLQFFIEKIHLLQSDFSNMFDDMLSEATLMDSEYVSLNVQILSHHVSKEKKLFYLKNLLGDLTDSSNDYFEKINDEHLKKLGVICCLIQDPEVLDEEVKNLLSTYFTLFSSISECPKCLDLFYVEFVSLMASLVQHSPFLITRNAWCFMQSLLSSYIKIGQSKNFDKAIDLLFVYQVSLAYSTSFSFISICEDTDVDMSWAPSVDDELSDGFLALFIYIGSIIKKSNPLSHAFEKALSRLLKATECIPENIIFGRIMNCCDAACNPTLDRLLPILLLDIQYLQLSTHAILMKVMPLLSESLSSDMKCDYEDTEDEEEKFPSKLTPLVHTLQTLSELMESILEDVKIGECCLVLPNSDPYKFVSAYLFSWLLMLEFISSAPSQMRQGYVAHLEETKHLPSLFSNVCCLLPENPLLCLKKTLGCDSPKKENLVSMFLHAPKISAGNQSSEEIQIMACHVLYTAMRKVPASVRTWWNNLDKKSADIVNKFTSKYISGILCSEEMQAVHDNENLFKNMVVKARLGSREVIATYTVDDFAIELCVQLPANYPLGPITAEKRGKVIIAQQEWRHWLMQLTTVLNFQNGSILDGLNIWKKNLDKKFEGVEECMICYYILHSSTLKLPKLSCHTCRKKFHSACLYKWFHSINNTKCPLCRNEFTI